MLQARQISNEVVNPPVNLEYSAKECDAVQANTIEYLYHKTHIKSFPEF